jgi:hypothetical protein
MSAEGNSASCRPGLARMEETDLGSETEFARGNAAGRR